MIPASTLSSVVVSDLPATMDALGERARAAARRLALADTETRNRALLAAAAALRAQTETIAAANAADLAAASELTPAMTDRLTLTPTRIAAMAEGVEAVASQPDPVGLVERAWDRPNGLHIEKVRVPLGVIGIIYESRPNVTADAAALCIKSGNAAILRGGSESARSSAAILACMRAGLEQAGLPADSVQAVPTQDRAAVGLLLGMDRHIDVIVPRGGRSLIERVARDSRIPVFKHLDGICHVYLDRSAKLETAVDVTLNAKMRRTGVCGSAETLLVDRAVAETLLPPVLDALIEAGCTIRGDAATCVLEPRAETATEEDWRTEYLAPILSVRVVDGIEAAIDHIEHYGSHHTDAIITEDPVAAERFLREVDSAIVLHNASTQFADGGEFGMGAEIGISTGKLHARGPVGAMELTSMKYRVHGQGQTRP